MDEGTKNEYEKYMTSIQAEFDKITTDFYSQGKIVEGAIEGKGMINWKAPLTIMQMLNATLEFDNAEKDLLNSFRNADLLEKIEEDTYTYEKEVGEGENKKKETISETKMVVTYASLDEYISWCNNNFHVIKKYQKAKNLEYDDNQNQLTESQIEQIKMLYKSTAFYDLFSDNFKSMYAYGEVKISDEKLQAIYDEFLKNAGTRYLMDHSNLSYDSCMSYYDCSSWVIHVLGHVGIMRIPNTRCYRDL